MTGLESGVAVGASELEPESGVRAVGARAGGTGSRVHQGRGCGLSGLSTMVEGVPELEPGSGRELPELELEPSGGGATGPGLRRNGCSVGTSSIGSRTILRKRMGHGKMNLLLEIASSHVFFFNRMI
jgi:hypothetical protein